MGKAQRAHQSPSVPMGTGFHPLPILPKNQIKLESWPGKLARWVLSNWNPIDNLVNNLTI
jgi:hypothetical protein